MTELPFETVKAINQYKPIEVDGLTLYPVKVEDYQDYLITKPAIEFLQQSLPVRLMSVPLLQALYQTDIEALQSGTEPLGMFPRALGFLSLSLRLGEGMALTERLKLFEVAIDTNDPLKLKALRFDTAQGTREITPAIFQRLRPILAAQNGIELLSDKANPELVQAERDIAEQNAPPLDLRFENLIHSVAALSGSDEEEIYGWAIKKLQDRQSTYKRILDYLMCGIGEMQGTSWKGGNPYPHPWFDKLSDRSAALMPMSEFANGAGLRAVQNAGGE